MKETTSPFAIKHPLEFIPRLAAVGIFLAENLNHVVNFHFEVHTYVLPAISPFPLGFAVAIHIITIFLGLSGALLIARASKMLAVFMVIITWNWWVRRFGTFIWDLEDELERKSRIIHCFKNLSILGLHWTIGSIASSSTHRK